MPGRVERRQSELEFAAAAYYLGKSPVEALCESAMKYAAAVIHNRHSRDKHKAKVGANGEQG